MTSRTTSYLEDSSSYCLAEVLIVETLKLCLTPSGLVVTSHVTLIIPPLSTGHCHLSSGRMGGDGEGEGIVGHPCEVSLSLSLPTHCCPSLHVVVVVIHGPFDLWRPRHCHLVGASLVVGYPLHPPLLSVVMHGRRARQASMRRCRHHSSPTSMCHYQSSVIAQGGREHCRRLSSTSLHCCQSLQEVGEGFWVRV